MRRIILRNHRLGLLLVCLLMSPIYVFGQDLGSSSGLFRKKTSSAKKKTTSKKKTAVKRKKSKKKKSASSKKSKARKKSGSARRSKRGTSRYTSRSKRNSTKKRKSTTARKTRSRTRKPTTRKKRIETASNKTKLNNDIIISVGDPQNSNVAELFERAIVDGNTSRNLRDYVNAEDAYSRARSLNSKDSRAIYGLGNIYSDQQRWEEAEQAYREAIRIEPADPAAHIAISFVLTQPIVGSNLGKRYVEAEKMARRAIELDKGNAIGYDQLGVALELRGMIGEETESAYRRAIDLAPEFALAYAHLGRLLRRHGLTKKSSAAYATAMRRAKDVPTMILVADVMQSQQRYSDSEILLRRALKQDDKNPTALFLLGRALTFRKKFDEAEKVLKKSVEVSPNSFVSYTLLGSLYYRSGKLTKSEQTLNRALSVISQKEKKRLAQEFEEVGDRYLKARRNTDAVRAYKRAIELDKTKESLASKMIQAQSNQ